MYDDIIIILLKVYTFVQWQLLLKGMRYVNCLFIVKYGRAWHLPAISGLATKSWVNLVANLSQCLTVIMLIKYAYTCTQGQHRIQLMSLSLWMRYYGRITYASDLK